MKMRSVDMDVSLLCAVVLCTFRTAGGVLPPDITGLPDSITLIESKAPSTALADKLFTFSASEPENQTFSCTIDPVVTGFTLIDGGGGQYNLFLSSNPGFEYDKQSQYLITMKCTDEDGDSSSGVLTVDILQNTPPAISGLPPSIGTNDGESAARKLSDVTVSDTEGDSYSCNITKNPASGPFNLQYTTKYEIWLDSSPSLDSALSPYYVTVTCSDSYGHSTATLSITVTPNSAPTLSGLPKDITVKEDDPGGRSLYTLTVSDIDGDLYSCSLTTTPTLAAISMQVNGTKYDVYLAKNHGIEYDTVKKYTITLSCTDGQVSTGTLTLNIQTNTPPSIDSLPKTETMTAGEAERILHTLTVSDTESDTITCSIGTTTPSGGPFVLRYETSIYKIYLVVGAAPASSYSVPVTCYDDYGSTNETLTVMVTTNDAPVITGLPVTVPVTETETASRILHTVAVTDAEGDTITCSVASTPSGPFSMQQNPAIPEYKVQLDANANLQLDSTVATSHTVNITCTDTQGGSMSGLLYVTVTGNSAPVISGLPTIKEISENDKVETKLWDLSVSDPESDSFLCLMVVSPASSDFDLRRDPVTNVSSVYLLAVPSLNPLVTQFYTLNFTCTDTPGRSTQNYLTIKVNENRPPAFTNLPATQANIDAKTTLKSATIFSVAATDDDGDTLFYSMTIEPSTNSFTINTVTGVITANQDLLTELVSTFVVNVTATDNKRSTTSTLGLTLINVNTPPAITNLVLNGITTVYKSESTAAGTVLFTMTVYDPDAGQTQTISFSTVPIGHTDMFTLTGNTFSLATGKNFDYETLTSYRLDITISDSITTVTPYFLQIDILQVGEPCVFPKDPYYAECYEGVKGAGNVDLAFALNDPDNPDTHTYTLIPTTYSSYFNINPNTGIITFDIDYDVDQGVHANNITLNVQCTDSYGETGTTTISLYIRDINDNDPYFNCGGKVLTFNQYTKPGGYIGFVNASDKDSGINAQLEYTGTSSTGNSYFTFAKNGNVYLKQVNFEYGVSHRFVVVAEDQGTPSRRGTCTIDIIYVESVTTTTTPTTTTAAPIGFWDDPGNVAMVAVLAAAALIALGLLLFFLLRNRHFGGCKKPNFRNPFRCKCNPCKRTPKQPKRVVVTPKDPKSQPFKLWDDNDLNVKREPFKTQRTEGSIPHTMVME